MAPTYGSNVNFVGDINDYSTSYDEESDYSTDDYQSSIDCSPIKAKVRFTRTTSTVQQLMEARQDSRGRTNHLFGCLRRTSSSQTMQYEEERVRDQRTPSPGVRSPKLSTVNNDGAAERRRQELEKTRKEVKRLDQLLEEKQRQDRCRFNIEPPVAEQQERPSCWKWCCGGDKNVYGPSHVQLEPFSGEPKDWPLFIHRFKTWIHDAIPDDTLRMIYLEELLSPEIKDEYSIFFRRADCYSHLLAHLQDRYGSPDSVARSCLMALKQLDPVDPTNPKTAASLSSEVQTIVDTLSAIGCENELQAFSTLEFSGLVDKLSGSLRKSWILHVKERPSLLPLPTLRDFSSWLNEEVAFHFHR